MSFLSLARHCYVSLLVTMHFTWFSVVKIALKVQNHGRSNLIFSFFKMI